ncbi:MAG: hypothetical protein AMXMBFR33_67170 [Candidatus Xenobia bacterium]
MAGVERRGGQDLDGARSDSGGKSGGVHRGPTVLVGDPSLQFTATATFSDGTTQDVTPVASYVSSAPAVLSVNAAGQATALSAGNAAVTADFQGVTSAPLNVLVIALTTINLTFAPAPTVNACSSPPPGFSPMAPPRI